MTKKHLGMAVALLALGTVVPFMSPAQAQTEGPSIEPEATRLLKRMTDYVGGLDGFSLDADNMIEEVLESGHKIQYGFNSSIAIQRPDKLRAERTVDLVRQLYVYDGSTLSILNSDDNYYASTAAPDNLDDLLHFARDTLDIVPPSGDMVYTNAFDLLTAGVTEGFVVGKSMVGGVKCDHLAFRTPVVDWQVWIAEGDEPLPYKYVLTTMDDPAHPQYIILMSNWNVAPELDDAMFQFTAPEGAKEIDFLRIDPGHATIH